MKTISAGRYSWRTFTDWAKRRPLLLRSAEQLGRGRGTLRLLDRLHAPPAAPLRPDLTAWHHHDVAAVWIGHATVLLRIGGMTVLTDPVFSLRIGLGAGLFTLGPRRRMLAALSIRQLPDIDLILLSHAHFDHLDRPTLARLDRRIPIITAPHTSDLIHDLGFRQIHELPWGGRCAVGDLAVSAIEVNHWGARTFVDRHRGYNGYLLQAGGHRILYAGDTAYHERFQCLAPVDLMIVGIAAYDPYIAAHANPEQAWVMTRHAQARYVLPFHHGTFRLSHEPMEEPMERLLKAAGDNARQIAIRQTGGQWALNGRH